MIRGWESRDELNAAEKYRFDVTVGIWLQAVEQAFADCRDGSYPEEFLEVHRKQYPHFSALRVAPRGGMRDRCGLVKASVKK